MRKTHLIVSLGLFSFSLDTGCGAPELVDRQAGQPGSSAVQSRPEHLPLPARPAFSSGNLAGGPFNTPNGAFWQVIADGGYYDWTVINGESPLSNHPMIELSTPPTIPNPNDFTVEALIANNQAGQELGLVVQTREGYYWTLSTAWGGFNAPTIGLFYNRSTWNPSEIAQGPGYAFTSSLWYLKMHVANGVIQGVIYPANQAQPAWQVQQNVAWWLDTSLVNLGYYNYNLVNGALLELMVQ